MRDFGHPAWSLTSPMKGIKMVINNIHAEIDALTAAAPNLVAVQLIVNLRGISFEDALAGQLRDWCTALDEAVDRSADYAARLVSHGENPAASAQQRQAFHLQAVEHFTEITPTQRASDRGPADARRRRNPSGQRTRKLPQLNNCGCSDRTNAPGQKDAGPGAIPLAMGEITMGKQHQNHHPRRPGHRHRELLHLDPAELVLDDNVRTDPVLGKDFIESIVPGIRLPLYAVRDADGTVKVRDGQRRMLAAREAALASIPVYVVPADAVESDDAERTRRRIIDQVIANEARAYLKVSEKAAAVEQLSLTGLSATKIAKVLHKSKRRSTLPRLPLARRPHVAWSTQRTSPWTRA